jgi:hypothetical protein
LKAFVLSFLVTAFAGELSAATIQGVIADWNCVQTMVREGREKTLRQNHSCSLAKNYRREAYGLITEDKKYYKLDDPGNNRILKILEHSPGKDNLHVVVTGDLDGDTLKVANISLL